MDKSIGLTLVMAAAACAIPLACGQGTSGNDLAEQSSAQVESDAASDADAGGDAATTTDISQPRLPVCSDGQVIAILHAVNNGEVQEAQAVRSRLTDANVRAYADRMITDHSQLDSALTSLAQAQGISVEENDISKQLTEDARMAIQSLSSMTGSELDSAYVTHAVIDHLKVLGHVDHLLAPSIQNAALASAAMTARAGVAEHARLATVLQTNIAGACGGGQADGGTTDGGGAADGGAGTGDGGGGTTDASTGTDAGTGTDGGSGGRTY